MKLDISETQKANVFSEADDGLFYSTIEEPHQTGEPWHPSCHGGKTPAKPNVFLRPCANSTQSGVKGHCP